MSLIEKLIGGGNVVKQVGDAIDNTFTSDEERLEKQNERYKAEREYNLKELTLLSELDKAQTEVNKAEAGSPSFFVAGWRPAIGWIGVVALGLQFLVYPILALVPGIHLPAQNPVSADMLWTIVTGMLGIGTMRSFDKMKKTDTTSIGN